MILVGLFHIRFLRLEELVRFHRDWLNPETTVARLAK